MPPFRFGLLSLAALLPVPFPGPAYGQTALDRVQPPNTEDERARVEEPSDRRPARIEVDVPRVAVAPTGAVRVGAIALKGLQSLTPADFADILATRVAQTLSPEALSGLADAIAQRARERGYVFAWAGIAAQQLRHGVLVVEVDEGRVDEVRFDGPEQPAVREALVPLTDGNPVRIAALERRLLIAGDVDGVTIQNSRFVREGSKGVLLIRVTTDRIAGRATLANEGTKPIGPEQLTLQMDVARLLADDDSLSLTWLETPAEPGELHYARARYEKRLNRSGTEVALIGSGSLARPGAYLEPLRIRSRSWYIAATVLQPLARRRTASLWFEGEFGVRNLLQWRNGERVRVDRVVAGRATLYGYADVASGRLRASMTVSRGLGIFGATPAGDPLASRWDANDTFTTLSSGADWTCDFGENVSFRLSMLNQISSDPLLVSEEIGLGGTGFLRGYDWSERSGDEGVAGLAEMRYTLDRPLGLAPRAQLYAFIDGGKVTNQGGGYGSGALASVGGGVRADLTRSFGANLELAVPLSGSRYDSNSKAPKIGFRLIKAF